MFEEKVIGRLSPSIDGRLDGPVTEAIVPSLMLAPGDALLETPSSVPLSGLSKGLKRALDVVLSVFAIVVLAPLAVLIAAAIRIDSQGPAFFRQTRIGRDGVPFELWKFRTMVVGAHSERSRLAAQNGSAGMFKLRNDPRTTAVGRLLRRTSLDELPQLLNVLRGQMSLVGPRPLVPEEDELVSGIHRARLSVAPGITGPWQVLGPHRPPLEEMVILDCAYAGGWSLRWDVAILWRTALHMVLLRGS